MYGMQWHQWHVCTDITMPKCSLKENVQGSITIFFWLTMKIWLFMLLVAISLLFLFNTFVCYPSHCEWLWAAYNIKVEIILCPNLSFPTLVSQMSFCYKWSFALSFFFTPFWDLLEFLQSFFMLDFWANFLIKWKVLLLFISVMYIQLPRGTPS